jgi:hypothetical protein
MVFGSGPPSKHVYAKTALHLLEKIAPALEKRLQQSIRVRYLPEGSGPGATATGAKGELLAVHSVSAAGPEVGADTEVGATAAVEATQLLEVKPGKNGGTAGLVEASAAAAASGISNTSPGHPTAAATMESTSTEGTARAGRDTLTGRTAAAAAAAADTEVATLPATSAVPVAGAAEAAGTGRPCNTSSSDRWRLHSADITNCLDYESFLSFLYI